MVIGHVALWILPIALITVGLLILREPSKQKWKQDQPDIFAEWRRVRDTEWRYIDDCGEIEPVTVWRVVEQEKRLVRGRLISG